MDCEDLEEQIGDEDNCLSSVNNKMCNGKKNLSFNLESNNFAVQTNVDISNNNSTPVVAQAITTSNDILSSTPLSNKSNLQNTAATTNETEYTANSMTPIDKLYSMQSSYFNNHTSDCENCINN